MREKTQELQLADQIGITLKKIETFSGHDGMMGINADICLDGKPFAHAYDDAWGGEMRIDVLGRIVQNEDGDYVDDPEREWSKKTMIRVDAILNMAPPYEWESNGEVYERRLGLDDLVNALVDRHMVKKDEKKGVVYTEENRDHVQYIRGWNVQIPTMIKKQSKDIVVRSLQKIVDDVLSKGGSVINQEYLQSLGVKF